MAVTILNCPHNRAFACRACLEFHERSPETLSRSRQRDRLLLITEAASNPFNRIEDREAELRRTLRTR